MGEFDSDRVAGLGWRQGAVLGAKLAQIAWTYAPATVKIGPEDWLIVISHDCDVVNFSLDKEPVIEVIRASSAVANKADKGLSAGRNPRNLQVPLATAGEQVVLSFSVHDRWTIPRENLLNEGPRSHLPEKERRLIAEWIAKRYIRAAFPTAFDLRWRSKKSNWEKLLKAHSEWIQGIYLSLNPSDELPDGEPYHCELIVAVPQAKRRGEVWVNKREELANAIEKFWDQFRPGILCDGAEARGTEEITLADLEDYLRFDADWVSFNDGTDVTPVQTDIWR